MEKSRKRAIRRAHYQRLKIKRSNHWGYPHTSYGSQEPEEMPDDVRASIATTSTPCSCWGCGNPRKHFGVPTLKEIAQYHDFVDQLDDLDIHTKYAKNRVTNNWW